MYEDICLIASEALFNAFQHAGTSRIGVAMQYDEDAFRILVQDYGKELPPEVMAQGGKPGHWGLSGMCERARRDVGSFTLRSDAANGMLIGVSLPALHAYARGPAGQPDSRLRALRAWLRSRRRSTTR